MKYVFLDQFVWINLRNSLCEKGDSRLFDYLRSKADGGECCFPLFLEHVQETQATPSQKTRIQLALIMLQLCREYAIRHFSRLKDFEIDAMYMNRNSWESPEQVIQWVCISQKANAVGSTSISMSIALVTVETRALEK